MYRKVIYIAAAIMLAFSLSACSLPEAPPAHSDEPTVVNTEEITPSPTATPTPVVTPRQNVSDDIKAQDICILSYFEALKQNDANRIIQISSGSLFGDVFSKGIDSEFIGELQSITVTQDLMRTTWQFIYSILSDSKPQTASPDYSKETIDEFVRQVDPARLSDIEILELGTPLKPQIPEALQPSMGAAITQRYCLFSVDGKTFCQLFWLVKSPDGYRLVVIGESNSYSFNGIAKPIELDEFETLVDPNTIHEPPKELIDSIPEMSGETYLQKIKAAPSPSFSSPEVAIDSFAEALAKSDTYGALSAFCIKEIAVNYDLYRSSEYYKCFMPYGDYCMVTAYDFYRDINIAIYCCEAASAIISLMFSFSFDFDLEAEFTTVDYYSAIQKSCDKLSSLSVIRSGVMAESASENMRKILLEQVAGLGADDTEHRVIEYKFNGKKFTGAFELLSYDGNWRIRRLTSVYLNLPADIPVAPSSKLDYDSYI